MRHRLPAPRAGAATIASLRLVNTDFGVLPTPLWNGQVERTAFVSWALARIDWKVIAHTRVFLSMKKRLGKA